MTAPLDDQLAAMLEARAARLGPTATREVMAAVRGEMQRPKGGALFSVVPVTRTRGMNGPAGWAAVGLVAVLVLAVMGGRLDTKPATPAGPNGSGSGSPASSVGVTDEPVATVMAPAANTITVAELRAGLDYGSLYGRIVLLTGSLRVTPLRCRGDCQRVEVTGLEGVGVRYRETSTSPADVRTIIDGHPGPSLMAFRVSVSDLVLLGWPQQGAQVALTVNGLMGQPGVPGPGDLAVVSGWLTPGSPGPSCPLIGESTTPCNSGPILSDGPPMPDGTEIYAQSVNVGLDPSVVFGTRSTAIEGPFLVRQVTAFGGNPPPYRVVASLNPENAVWVETGPSSMAMTVDQFRAALEDGSMDGRLIAVTGWLQPSGALCPADVPQPCTLFVILGLGIGVTWDGPVSTTSRLYGEVLQPPSTTARTLFVTPRNGHLALLGRLIGDLEQPASIQELTDGRLLWPRMVPLALTAVSGWLVVARIHSCPFLGPDATPCPGPDPLLTDVEPSPDGRMTNYDRQQPVRVWPGAVGIDPAQVVTPGPFLYRIAVGSTCDGLDRSEGWTCAGGPTSAWEVMARYDASTVFRVVVP